jgi:pectate lyase
LSPFPSKSSRLVPSPWSPELISVSTYFHDHWKASLAGHSDSNGGEDTGKLHITYANNHWKNINSRGPLLRFGTGHIYNSFFEK